MRGLEAINSRLAKLFAPHTETSKWHNTAAVDAAMEIIFRLLDDAHHRVSGEAMVALRSCMEIAPSDLCARIGSFLPALFMRLADKRPHIREDANALLNIVRVKFEPAMIFSSLLPRIVDFSDKTKTALMQFLGVIVPHCGEHFQNFPQQTSSFLAKMAVVLSSKPSNTLFVACRRLLELIYKAAPQVKHSNYCIHSAYCEL